MKSTFSIIFYLKRQVVKKDGTVPVMGRITVDGTLSGDYGQGQLRHCRQGEERLSWLGVSLPYTDESLFPKP